MKRWSYKRNWPQCMSPALIEATMTQNFFSIRQKYGVNESDKQKKETNNHAKIKLFKTL